MSPVLAQLMMIEALLQVNFYSMKQQSMLVHCVAPHSVHRACASLTVITLSVYALVRSECGN